MEIIKEKKDNSMLKIFIFGTGKSAQIVESNLLRNNISIIGYLDNNKFKQGQFYKDIPVISPNQIHQYSYDYIIIATIHYESVLNQLVSLGVNDKKLIAFFSDEYIGRDEYKEIIDLSNWKYEVLNSRINIKVAKYEKTLQSFINNIEYEIVDKMKVNNYKFPIIKSGEEAIRRIIEDKCSISRFGDGEFELIAEKARPKFQQPNHLLAVRLKEVLESNKDNLIIAIADNYGSLEKYEVDAAMDIREYMTPDVRKYHMKLLVEDKIYYDTYLTRPYIIYKDKDAAKQKFEFLMKIWQEKDLMIIEGNKSRLGLGNNLFDKAKSIKRILAPSEDAFSKYDDILYEALKTDKDTLILIALGPTATVLAYDLAIKGFQAIDIGHIDIEYEWFLQGEGKRIIIKNKYVNEVSGGDIVEDVNDEWYNSQIVASVY